MADQNWLQMLRGGTEREGEGEGEREREGGGGKREREMQHPLRVGTPIPHVQHTSECSMKKGCVVLSAHMMVRPRQ